MGREEEGRSGEGGRGGCMWGGRKRKVEVGREGEKGACGEGRVGGRRVEVEGTRNFFMSLVLP